MSPRGFRRLFQALLGVAAVAAAGCHGTNNVSDYAISWVSLTSEPGPFTSYQINIDSVTLTRSDGVVVTALSTPETVDFVKLRNREELWGTATIPIGRYVSASIVLDYSNPNISVMVNGVPQQATVVDSTGATGTKLTTETININLDPETAYQLTGLPTYATTSAERFAIDFDLNASTTSINYMTTPATVTIRPYLTAAVAPADNKPLRIRGPLINSNVSLGTYTVYTRPFYDAVDNLGTLSLFTSPSTIYTINGIVSQGSAGLTQLSQSSAGITVTAAYTTFEPTATPTGVAGKFNVAYVVAGSTLEDVYTSGLEGDVIARSGNTLTLQGATLSLNDGVSTYNEANATVLLGAGTLVTADDNVSLTGLNANSIAVGQHIAVRGIYSLPNNVVTLDATGTSATNTGSVRILPTHLWGSLVSTGTGGLVLNLERINDWPVSDYNFAGNGSSTATTPAPANFQVDTAALALPAAAVGDPLWVDGLFAPFGSAPPAFNASAVNDESSVQTAGAAAGGLTCGPANPDCVPASMHVVWTSPGTAAPFATLSSGGLTIDLTNPALSTATINIGPESIVMTSLPSTPQILPTAVPAPVTANTNSPGSTTQTLPPVFLPRYAYGNPVAVSPGGVYVDSSFGDFATNVPAAISAAAAVELDATGTFDRSANTFTALSIDLVLN